MKPTKTKLIENFLETYEIPSGFVVEPIAIAYELYESTHKKMGLSVPYYLFESIYNKIVLGLPK